MRRRRLRHKSLVLCERIAKHWNKQGGKVHVAKDEHGFYYVSFDKESSGRIWY